MQSFAPTFAAKSKAFSSVIASFENLKIPQLSKKCVVDPELPRLPPNF